MEGFLQKLNNDITEIFRYNISTSKAYTVPSRDDERLTFSIGAEKQGKLIETCVLMIDIRNSTKISKNLNHDKVFLGKIYSAFIYAMASIADEYGYVRNIIGDRIMVVFEPKDCYKNAINCAAVMYTVGSRILKRHIGIEDFKIGIGIDYGEMLVLKTGIKKKHDEKSEYKNLVWGGDTANSASKFCDFANKNYCSPIFKITYEYTTFEKREIPILPNFSNPIESLFNEIKPRIPFDGKLSFKTHTKTVSIDYIEFGNKIVIGPDGWKYDGKKVIAFDLERKAGTSDPILMSLKVYKEYRASEPDSIFLDKITLKNYPDLQQIGSKVYGGTLIVPEISKIKI